jgi:hypothetical protein
MQSWAELFGKENIIIRPYEKQQMPHGTLHDFCVHVLKCSPPKNSGHSANITPGKSIVRLCARLLDYFDKDTVHGIISGIRQDAFPHDAGKLLHHEARRAILQRYEQENRTLALEYLGREEHEGLFFEPLPTSEKYPASEEKIDRKHLPVLAAHVARALNTLHRDVDERLLFHILDISRTSGVAGAYPVSVTLSPDNAPEDALVHLVIRCPQTNAPERLYALQTLFCEFLGLRVRVEWADLDCWEVCLPDSRRIIKITDALFARHADGQWLTPAAMPTKAAWLRHEATPDSLPVFYGVPDLHYEDGVWHCGPDIPAMIFFMLTRFEETFSFF